MNSNMLCSRCKKRMAVVFIGREENGKVINEGLCIQCAKELGIPQVSAMLDKPINGVRQKTDVFSQVRKKQGDKT